MLEKELSMDFDESGEMNMKNLRNQSNDSCDEGMSEDDVVDEGIPNKLYQKQSANLENLVSTKQESSGISKKRTKSSFSSSKNRPYKNTRPKKLRWKLVIYTRLATFIQNE